MARATTSILNQMLAQISSDTVLSSKLTGVSQTNIYRLWAYITAVAMNTEETINDAFLARAEAAISSNPPANVNWLYRYALAFQYSATTPQAIQLDTTTLIPYYPVLNTSLRIITKCAIVSPYINSAGIIVGTPGAVLVKVAKGLVPAALSIAELSAFQTYLNIIKPAGIIYKAFSVAADKIFCNVKIWYNGGYASIIQTNVYNAYINYISNIDFNGIIKVIDLEIALKNVEGVNDIDIIDLNYRSFSIPLVPTACNMINGNLQTKVDSSSLVYAGYAQDETTVGYDFLTINATNFIAQ